jgi:hypothetical protein
MRIDTFLLADAASGAGGKLFIHGGGISRVNAPAFPFVLPQLALAARFVLDEADYGQSHRFEALVRDPTNTQIFAMKPVEFEIPPPPSSHFEGEEHALQFALNMSPLTFEDAGIYRFELRVNGELVRAMPLPAVLLQPSEPLRPRWE